MQDVWVVGVDLERLLATELRVEISSGRRVVKAGLIKRSRRNSACCVRVLGSSGGCAACLTVHQLVSTYLTVKR
jgi:hypothetical protein